MAKQKKKFTIPKIATSRELLQTCHTGSREYSKIVSEVERSLLNSKCGLKIIEVKLVNNDTLSSLFNQKKLEIQKESSSRRQEVTYGFKFVGDYQQAKKICKDGLTTNTFDINKSTCLGDPKCGVYLSRCADVLTRHPLMQEKVFMMVVFQVLKGRFKSIAEQHGFVNSLMEPTPSYDCHLSKEFRKTEPTSSRIPSGYSRLFDSSQMYLYEINMKLEELYVQRPRHCNPVAIVSFKFESPSLPSEETQQYEVQQKITPVKAPEKPFALKSDPLGRYFALEREKAITIWSGKLFNKLTSLTDVVIKCHATDSIGNLPLFGNHLSIRMKMNIADLQRSLPGKLFEVPPIRSKIPRACHKNREYLCCEMYPMNDRSTTFARLKRLLMIGSKAFFLKLPKGYDLFILPSCDLTNTLGITFSNYPDVLHLLFTRKIPDDTWFQKKNEIFFTDARNILQSRLLELEKLKLTTPVVAPGPVQDAENDSEPTFPYDEEWEQYPLFFTDIEKDAIRVKIQRTRQAVTKEMIMCGQRKYRHCYKTPYFLTEPGGRQLQHQESPVHPCIDDTSQSTESRCSTQPRTDVKLDAFSNTYDQFAHCDAHQDSVQGFSKSSSSNNVANMNITSRDPRLQHLSSNPENTEYSVTINRSSSKIAEPSSQSSPFFSQKSERQPKRPQDPRLRARSPSVSSPKTKKMADESIPLWSDRHISEPVANESPLWSDPRDKVRNRDSFIATGSLENIPHTKSSYQIECSLSHADSSSLSLNNKNAMEVQHFPLKNNENYGHQSSEFKSSVPFQRNESQTELRKEREEELKGSMNRRFEEPVSNAGEDNIPMSPPPPLPPVLANLVQNSSQKCNPPFPQGSHTVAVGRPVNVEESGPRAGKQSSKTVASIEVGNHVDPSCSKIEMNMISTTEKYEASLVKPSSLNGVLVGSTNQHQFKTSAKEEDLKTDIHSTSYSYSSISKGNLEEGNLPTASSQSPEPAFAATEKKDVASKVDSPISENHKFDTLDANVRRNAETKRQDVSNIVNANKLSIIDYRQRSSVAQQQVLRYQNQIACHGQCFVPYTPLPSPPAFPPFIQRFIPSIANTRPSLATTGYFPPWKEQVQQNALETTNDITENSKKCGTVQCVVDGDTVTAERTINLIPRSQCQDQTMGLSQVGNIEISLQTTCAESVGSKDHVISVPAEIDRACDESASFSKGDITGPPNDASCSIDSDDKSVASTSKKRFTVERGEDDVSLICEKEFIVEQEEDNVEAGNREAVSEPIENVNEEIVNDEELKNSEMEVKLTELKETRQGSFSKKHMQIEECEKEGLLIQTNELPPPSKLERHFKAQDSERNKFVVVSTASDKNQAIEECSSNRFIESQGKMINACPLTDNVNSSEYPSVTFCNEQNVPHSSHTVVVDVTESIVGAKMTDPAAIPSETLNEKGVVMSIIAIDAKLSRALPVDDVTEHLENETSTLSRSAINLRRNIQSDKKKNEQSNTDRVEEKERGSVNADIESKQRLPNKVSKSESSYRGRRAASLERNRQRRSDHSRQRQRSWDLSQHHRRRRSSSSSSSSSRSEKRRRKKRHSGDSVHSKDRKKMLLSEGIINKYRDRDRDTHDKLLLSTKSADIVEEQKKGDISKLINPSLVESGSKKIAFNVSKDSSLGKWYATKYDANDGVSERSATTFESIPPYFSKQDVLHTHSEPQINLSVSIVQCDSISGTDIYGGISPISDADSDGNDRQNHHCQRQLINGGTIKSSNRDTSVVCVEEQYCRAMERDGTKCDAIDPFGQSVVKDQERFKTTDTIELDVDFAGSHVQATFGQNSLDTDHVDLEKVDRNRIRRAGTDSQVQGASAIMQNLMSYSQNKAITLSKNLLSPKIQVHPFILDQGREANAKYLTEQEDGLKQSTSPEISDLPKSKEDTAFEARQLHSEGEVQESSSKKASVKEPGSTPIAFAESVKAISDSTKSCVGVAVNDSSMLEVEMVTDEEYDQSLHAIDESNAITSQVATNSVDDGLKTDDDARVELYKQMQSGTHFFESESKSFIDSKDSVESNVTEENHADENHGSVHRARSRVDTQTEANKEDPPFHSEKNRKPKHDDLKTFPSRANRTEDKEPYSYFSEKVNSYQRSWAQNQIELMDRQLKNDFRNDGKDTVISEKDPQRLAKASIENVKESDAPSGHCSRSFAGKEVSYSENWLQIRQPLYGDRAPFFDDKITNRDHNWRGATKQDNSMAADDIHSEMMLNNKKIVPNIKSRVGDHISPERIHNFEAHGDRSRNERRPFLLPRELESNGGYQKGSVKSSYSADYRLRGNSIFDKNSKTPDESVDETLGKRYLCLKYRNEWREDRAFDQYDVRRIRSLSSEKDLERSEGRYASRKYPAHYWPNDDMNESFESYDSNRSRQIGRKEIPRAFDLRQHLSNKRNATMPSLLDVYELKESRKTRQEFIERHNRQREQNRAAMGNGTSSRAQAFHRKKSIPSRVGDELSLEPREFQPSARCLMDIEFSRDYVNSRKRRGSHEGKSDDMTNRRSMRPLDVIHKRRKYQEIRKQDEDEYASRSSERPFFGEVLYDEDRQYARRLTRDHSGYTGQFRKWNDL